MDSSTPHSTNAELTTSVPRPAVGLCLATVPLLVLLSSCGHGATLVQETPTGGVITYGFQTEADVLSSSVRRDAMGIAAAQCPNGYRIVKEGEVPKVSASADRNWRGQMGMDRRWGIQFACK